MNLTYCDYIAATLLEALRNDIVDEYNAILKDAGPIKLDLHETEGFMLTTKKEIPVVDLNGKKYRITVEEV
jgi:hypothetical protein